MNLYGTLIPELGKLSHLDVIDFLWNDLSGSIPKETFYMDEIENNLRIELESAQPTPNTSQSLKSGDVVVESRTSIEAQADTDASKSSILDKLESKRKELLSGKSQKTNSPLISRSSREEAVQDLEKKWSKVLDTLKQPSPGVLAVCCAEC